MFEFLKSKKRKEQERLEKEALEARKKRLAQQPYKRNPLPPTSQQIDGNDYSAAYWLAQPSSYASEGRSFISANDTSNKLSEGSGSFSGAGSSSSWDDDSSSRSYSPSNSSSSYSSSDSYSSSSDSSSSSSDSSSSYNSD